MDYTGKKKKVAIYGGAFDPITNAHLTCAAEIIRSQMADEVWLVPSGHRDDKNMSSGTDRLSMCQIAVSTTFSPKFPVKVHPIEIERNGQIDTYDLLSELSNMNQDKEFTFVIGTDWVVKDTGIEGWTSKNHDWKEGDPEENKKIVTGHKMIEKFEFLVLPRPGYEINKEAPHLKKFKKLQWMELPDKMQFASLQLSSSEVRKRVAYDHRIIEAAERGTYESVDGLVPQGVLNYIKRSQLYFAA